VEVSIQGSPIYFEIPIFGGLLITETLVVTWVVMAILAGLCLWLTRGLTVTNVSKKQAVAEYLVSTAEKFVRGNMGEKFKHYVPFVAALFSLSVLSSLSSLFGFFAPTADLSTVLSWALLVFGLITYTKIKTHGFGGYLLGYTKPIAVLTPFNILGELATPISMGFRHFGNIVSGYVISTLIYASLAVASSMLFGWIPGAFGDVLGSIPLLSVGIPAALSLYFDWFASFMQAFIFCMLTTLYIANAAAEE